MVLSYQQPPLHSQGQVAAAVAELLVRNHSPAFRMVSPRITDGPPLRLIVQAYDRPVLFADEMGNQPRAESPSKGHRRTPTMPPSSSSSRHHRSSTTAGSAHKQGRKRSASFSDFLPPHLIARASTSPDIPAAPARPRQAGARGASVRSAPPSPPPPLYVDEKKAASEWWSSSPTDTKVSSLPTLSAVPPPLPPKDRPVSKGRHQQQKQQQQQQQQSGGTCTPHVAMRLTARVFGRTLGAGRGGQRSREEPSRDNGWVVV